MKFPIQIKIFVLAEIIFKLAHLKCKKHKKNFVYKISIYFTINNTTDHLYIKNFCFIKRKLKNKNKNIIINNIINDFCTINDNKWGTGDNLISIYKVVRRD